MLCHDPLFAFISIIQCESFSNAYSLILEEPELLNKKIRCPKFNYAGL